MDYSVAVELIMRNLTILSLFVFQLIGCKPAEPFSYLPISDERWIGPAEQLIEFDKSFKPVKQVNEVCFAYSEETTIANITSFPVLSDHSEMRVSATLIDSAHNRTELEDITRNGPHYLCLAPSDYTAWLNISNTDVQFTVLIVRANRAIHIQKIEWKTYNAWDLK